MLFIASGAFHAVKPSDMLPELQGRLPIRVELNGLTEDDLYKILTEPEANVSYGIVFARRFRPLVCIMRFLLPCASTVHRTSWWSNKSH
jgi:hypothetical protein